MGYLRILEGVINAFDEPTKETELQSVRNALSQIIQAAQESSSGDKGAVKKITLLHVAQKVLREKLKGFASFEEVPLDRLLAKFSVTEDQFYSCIESVFKMGPEKEKGLRIEYLFSLQKDERQEFVRFYVSAIGQTMAKYLSGFNAPVDWSTDKPKYVQEMFLAVFKYATPAQLAQILDKLYAANPVFAREFVRYFVANYYKPLLAQAPTVEVMANLESLVAWANLKGDSSIKVGLHPLQGAHWVVEDEDNEKFTRNLLGLVVNKDGTLLPTYQFHPAKRQTELLHLLIGLSAGDLNRVKNELEQQPDLYASKKQYGIFSLATGRLSAAQKSAREEILEAISDVQLLQSIAAEEKTLDDLDAKFVGKSQGYKQQAIVPLLQVMNSVYRTESSKQQVAWRQSVRASQQRWAKAMSLVDSDTQQIKQEDVAEFLRLTAIDLKGVEVDKITTLSLIVGGKGGQVVYGVMANMQSGEKISLPNPYIAFQQTVAPKNVEEKQQAFDGKRQAFLKSIISKCYSIGGINAVLALVRAIYNEASAIGDEVGMRQAQYCAMQATQLVIGEEGTKVIVAMMPYFTSEDSEKILERLIARGGENFSAYKQHVTSVSMQTVAADGLADAQKEQELVLKEINTLLAPSLIIDGQMKVLMDLSYQLTNSELEAKEQAKIAWNNFIVNELHVPTEKQDQLKLLASRLAMVNKRIEFCERIQRQYQNSPKIEYLSDITGDLNSILHLMLQMSTEEAKALLADNPELLSLFMQALSSPDIVNRFEAKEFKRLFDLLEDKSLKADEAGYNQILAIITALQAHMSIFPSDEATQSLEGKLTDYFNSKLGERDTFLFWDTTKNQFTDALKLAKEVYNPKHLVMYPYLKDMLLRRIDSELWSKEDEDKVKALNISDAIVIAQHLEQIIKRKGFDSNRWQETFTFVCEQIVLKITAADSKQLNALSKEEILWIFNQDVCIGQKQFFHDAILLLRISEAKKSGVLFTLVDLIKQDELSLTFENVNKLKTIILSGFIPELYVNYRTQTGTGFDISWQMAMVVETFSALMVDAVKDDKALAEYTNDKALKQYEVWCEEQAKGKQPVDIIKAIDIVVTLLAAYIVANKKLFDIERYIDQLQLPQNSRSIEALVNAIGDATLKSQLCCAILGSKKYKIDDSGRNEFLLKNLTDKDIQTLLSVDTGVLHTVLGFMFGNYEKYEGMILSRAGDAKIDLTIRDNFIYSVLNVAKDKKVSFASRQKLSDSLSPARAWTLIQQESFTDEAIRAHLCIRLIKEGFVSLDGKDATKPTVSQLLDHFKTSTDKLTAKTDAEATVVQKEFIDELPGKLKGKEEIAKQVWEGVQGWSGEYVKYEFQKKLLEIFVEKLPIETLTAWLTKAYTARMNIYADAVKGTFAAALPPYCALPIYMCENVSSSTATFGNLVKEFYKAPEQERSPELQRFFAEFFVQRKRTSTRTQTSTNFIKAYKEYCTAKGVTPSADVLLELFVNITHDSLVKTGADTKVQELFDYYNGHLPDDAQDAMLTAFLLYLKNQLPINKELINHVLSNGIVKDTKNTYLQYLRVYLDIKVNGEKATVLQNIADKDVQQAVCYSLFVNDMDMLKFVRRDDSVVNSLTDQLMSLLSSSPGLRDEVFGRLLRKVDQEPLVKNMLESISKEQMDQLLNYRLGYKLSSETEGGNAELRGYREMQDFTNISKTSAEKLELVRFSYGGYFNLRDDILSADQNKRDSAAESLIKLSSKTNKIDRVMGVLDRVWLDSAEPSHKGCDVTALRKATHACFKQKHKDSILPWWIHYAAYSIKWAFTPSAKLRAQALSASYVRSGETKELLTKDRTADLIMSDKVYGEVQKIDVGKMLHESELAFRPRAADKSVATTRGRDLGWLSRSDTPTEVSTTGFQHQ